MQCYFHQIIAFKTTMNTCATGLQRFEAVRECLSLPHLVSMQPGAFAMEIRLSIALGGILRTLLAAMDGGKSRGNGLQEVV